MFYKVLEGIAPLNQDIKEKASKRMDSLIKPLGSLGKLEDIAVQVAGIKGKVINDINKKCVIVMAADNGVVEEGVSSAPKEITAIQTVNMLKGMTGISVLCKQATSDVKVVDIGIDEDISCAGLVTKKIKKGTDNMAKGRAMTREEAVEAIEVGIEMVKNLNDEGYDLLGTGEMGIGNTSTSSAVLMAFTDIDDDKAVGKGAGMGEEAFENKKKVINKALEINKPDKNDPLDILSKVGGLDIAGLVGCFLGAAYYKVPIVIDGVISGAAALIAYKLNPLAKEYMIPSHYSKEPAYEFIMKELGIKPNICLNMGLGEGTGCPLMFHIIESALSVMKNMATFEEMSMNNAYLIDMREESHG